MAIMAAIHRFESSAAQVGTDDFEFFYNYRVT
jgi:hypothetical protein